MRYLIAFGLNLFDALATAFGLHLGLIEEGNPLLSGLSVTALLLVKVTLISAFVLFLSFHKERQSSAKGALIICGVYLHIFILHLEWIGAAF